MLRPGQSVDVHATVTGISGQHTDRVRVAGSPLVPCTVEDQASLPQLENIQKASGRADSRGVAVDGRLLCADRSVESNSDDWNALEVALPETGSVVVLPLALAAAAVMTGLIIFQLVRQMSASNHGRQ